MPAKSANTGAHCISLAHLCGRSNERRRLNNPCVYTRLIYSSRDDTDFEGEYIDSGFIGKRMIYAILSLGMHSLFESPKYLSSTMEARS